MQRFVGTSLLYFLLLHLPPAQMFHLPEERPSRVTFMEVLGKSMCQPMEQLVDVEQEFPDDVEYLYIPACVPLWRCSGCCIDEQLECHPTAQRNITLEVMRINSLAQMEHVELTFVEHQECKCRLSQKPQTDNNNSESIKYRPRRRKCKKTATGCGESQFPKMRKNLG
ncbi:unnamed protein product [Menidia menidia]|uniref:(Atlantic silverside) hypothetical protein n=1 Tax=Menidia menidia TaxID=238744 RepID=A0A8S4BDI3_9TELE|nr:unnamed protein product [Menidia menidia]